MIAVTSSTVLRRRRLTTACSRSVVHSRMSPSRTPRASRICFGMTLGYPFDTFVLLIIRNPRCDSGTHKAYRAFCRVLSRRRLAEPRDDEPLVQHRQERRGPRPLLPPQEHEVQVPEEPRRVDGELPALRQRDHGLLD